MFKYDKAILVGVDGSDASYKATWWAANYAKHAGLSLHIVCAYSLPSYAAVSFEASYTAVGDDVLAHKDAQDILGKAKAIAVEQGVKVTTLIVTGDPASVFVELSRNYNLIVIGNRGKGGLAERMLGTTSSSLPAYAYCPIVVVPYTDDDGKLMHLNNTIENVVVGSDESKWGLKALQIAAQFADHWGAKLAVLSAVPTFSGMSPFEGADPVANEETKSVLESYLHDLKVRIQPIRTQYPNLVIEESVVPGSAVGALTEAGDTNDVIVVGSRGRGGFTGLILGSVSQGLIQHAAKPVYVVPRKYVEMEKDDKATAATASEMPKVSIDDIAGVEQIDISQAPSQVAEDIASTIDSEHDSN